MLRRTLPVVSVSVMLAACSASAPGPVVSRSLPPPPASLTADAPLPAIRAGQSMGEVIAEQRAAAAEERRRRLAIVGWYRGVQRAYGQGR